VTQGRKKKKKKNPSGGYSMKTEFNKGAFHVEFSIFYLPIKYKKGEFGSFPLPLSLPPLSLNTP
jgi:hypothetical protein